MEITNAEILDQRLNQTFKRAISFQCIGILILAFLAYFELLGWNKTGFILSIVVFISSVFIAKPYFYAEKQLEQFKTSKSVRRSYEHFFLSYFPYTFWCPLIGVFL